MKKIILAICILPVCAWGGKLLTSCPAGYYMISGDTASTIAETCPTGYYAVSTAESCLADSFVGACFMYAPVGMSFTDDTGTYEFTDACTMSN